MPSVSLLPSSMNAEQDRSAARRIEPLATLPLFFKLEAQKVLVAGGSAAAAWKVELLVAAGAQVQLYAAALDAAFQPLLEDDAFPGCISWHRQEWTDESFSDAVIAIADIALKAVIQQGWPEQKTALPGIIFPYYNMRDEMSVQDKLIFKEVKVVVPRAIRGNLMGSQCAS